MKFSYEDLISGDSIPVDGIGHFRSPKLRELKPTQGIGTWNYQLYLNILSWSKEKIVEVHKMSSPKKAAMIAKNKQLSSYDAIILIENSRELLRKAMAFFMDENIVWDDKTRSFLCVSKDDEKIIGIINRENFEEVRDMMLQLNYVNVGDKAKPVKHSSKKSKQLWERCQEYLKQETEKAPVDKNMTLGNIISKLCISNSGYNLLNIYDLTVFQLYDQFFQYGYLRAMKLNDMVFSNHGGKDFDMQAWIKPITKF